MYIYSFSTSSYLHQTFTMPVYKVNYFDNRGRAETIRMILALKEQQFTDRRIAPEDWETISNTGYLPKSPCVLHI